MLSLSSLFFLPREEPAGRLLYQTTVIQKLHTIFRPKLFGKCSFCERSLGMGVVFLLLKRT